MPSPRDLNLERLLAERLLGWRPSGQGWRDGANRTVASFAPLSRREDAEQVVYRMQELGFRFEDRIVQVGDGGRAVLASFFKGHEVYSSLAETESAAIVNAAVRYLMKQAGAEAPAERVPAVEFSDEVGEQRRK